jgi:hypothetical protein
MKPIIRLLSPLAAAILLSGCASNQPVTSLARETSVNLANLASQYQRFAQTNQAIAEAREQGSATLQEVNREAAKVLMLDVELTRKTDSSAIERYEELANWADQVIQLDAVEFGSNGLEEADYSLASLNRDQVKGLMAVAEKLALLAREEAPTQDQADSERVAGEIVSHSDSRMQTALEMLEQAGQGIGSSDYLKAATQPELPLVPSENHAALPHHGNESLATPIYYDEAAPLIGESGWLEYRAGAWEPVRQQYRKADAPPRHSRGFARR